MTSTEIKKNGFIMNVIAAGQSILGMTMVFGEGMRPHTQMDEAPFTVNGAPVFHIGYNPFPFDHDQPRPGLPKWGEFTHPYMMPGMPDVPGSVKLYVDASPEGHYWLAGKFQLDQNLSGPSYEYTEVVCWTPRRPGDTREKAGERMFHALLMHMHDLRLETDVVEFKEENPRWVEEWKPSPRCMAVFRKILK